MTNPSPPKPRKADLGRWLLTAAVVLGGCGYVFRHSLFPADHATPIQVQEAAAMAVSVVTAYRRPMSRQATATGTLVARHEVLIVAEIVGARTVKVVADVGDRVIAGQVLAVLDGQRINLLLAQKAADRARTEAAIAQAMALADEAAVAAADAGVMLKRSQALQVGGTISAQLLAERETAAATALARAKAQFRALDAARADLLRVTAERDELLWQRGQLEVRAAAAGIVIERTAQPGQATTGDGTPLFRIMAGGEVEMEALVLETALSEISAGQTVRIAVAGEARSIRGQVRLAAPSVDPETRLGKVWISLDADGLKPGNSAVAVFDIGQREAILLPQAAVLAGAAGSRVLVVEGGLVTFRRVETGLITASGIEITAGLEPGETVIALAGPFLREGSRVIPVPVGGEGEF
jgi:HlyD family secretion protein